MKKDGVKANLVNATEPYSGKDWGISFYANEDTIWKNRVSEGNGEVAYEFKE